MLVLVLYAKKHVALGNVCLRTPSLEDGALPIEDQTRLWQNLQRGLIPGGGHLLEGQSFQSFLLRVEEPNF